jgi:hypothetical protein
MTSIRRTGLALLVSIALGLPALASADAPFEACEGDKAEHKQPTAERGTKDNAKGQKSDKSDNKQSDKPQPDQSGKTS